VSAAGVWIDSLGRLEQEKYAALIWDERWLLYYWQEAYGNLFEDIVHFDEQTRQAQAEKVQPPTDSLFQIIDQTLFERRYDLFQKINGAFLNQEERLFATMLLEYLLRMNTDKEEWNARIASFSKRFPNSRFNAFLGTTRQNVLKAGKQAMSLDIMFTNGNWLGKIERYINPVFAADFGLSWWGKRLMIGARVTVGGPNVAKDLPYAGNIWPKGARTAFAQYELEAGYDMLNQARLRISPVLGAGWSVLKSPAPSPDDNYNPPDYYSNFFFSKPHLTAAVVTDIKFPMKNLEDINVPPGSYNGLRLRFGYRQMFFGGKTAYLQGNLFFISVGYCLFVYGPSM
jgi:hypothetical protein